MHVLVDAQRVRLELLGELSVLDDVGVGDNGAGEVAGAQAVDRVRVPSRNTLLTICPHKNEPVAG